MFSTLVGSFLGARDAKKAANAQANFTQQATDAAINDVISGRRNANAYLDPIRQKGLSALDDYFAFVTGGAGAEDVASRLGVNSEGFKFRTTQGLADLNDALSARGGLDGNQARALEEFRMGSATDELDRGLARLAGLAQLGPDTANTMAGMAMNEGAQRANYRFGGGVAAGGGRASSFLNNPLTSAFRGLGQIEQAIAGTVVGNQGFQSRLSSLFA